MNILGEIRDFRGFRVVIANSLPVNRRAILTKRGHFSTPKHTLEVVDAVAEATGFGPDAANGLKGRVRSNLAYLLRARGAVVRDGDRETAVWKLAAVAEIDSLHKIRRQSAFAETAREFEPVMHGMSNRRMAARARVIFSSHHHQLTAGGRQRGRKRKAAHEHEGQIAED